MVTITFYTSQNGPIMGKLYKKNPHNLHFKLSKLATALPFIFYFFCTMQVFEQALGKEEEKKNLSHP